MDQAQAFLRSFNVALPGTPLWADQEIELYHGTSDIHVASVVMAVDVTMGSGLKDFGRWSRTKANHFRAQIDSMPFEQMELFYHSEPFDVACRLAQHGIDMGRRLSRYLKIRDGLDSQKA